MLSEREEILRGTAGARSARSMARLLGRSPSTVSREINREWAAMIDTEQRWRMRWPEPELVVRNIVTWRTIDGSDRR